MRAACDERCIAGILTSILFKPKRLHRHEIFLQNRARELPNDKARYEIENDSMHLLLHNVADYNLLLSVDGYSAVTDDTEAGEHRHGLQSLQAGYIHQRVERRLCNHQLAEWFTRHVTACREICEKFALYCELARRAAHQAVAHRPRGCELVDVHCENQLHFVGLGWGPG